MCRSAVQPIIHGLIGETRYMNIVQTLISWSFDTDQGRVFYFGENQNF
jgi:hypothetical protein